MTDFYKQCDETLSSWKRTDEKENQFTVTEQESKETYGTIVFDYDLSGLDSCSREYIAYQLKMLRSYNEIMFYSIRKQIESMEGRKPTKGELEEIADDIKTIDMLYKEVNDTIKEIQEKNRPVQRKLESKNENNQSE